MSTKTACVVGAGASGIAALKECVRYGFKTTCYELHSEVGGTWYRKDPAASNTPQVWDVLVSNTSKFNNCYSDLPPEQDVPVIMPIEAMAGYIKRAVDHFGLGKCIHFNTRVIQMIRKIEAGFVRRQWIESLQSSTVRAAVFIFVQGHAGIMRHEKPERLDSEPMDRADIINTLREMGRVGDFESNESTSLGGMKELVIKIRKTSDHEKTGKWEVYTTERGSDVAGEDLAGPRRTDDVTLSKCHKEVFDFVLVCSGHFKVPSFPDIPGSDSFKGTIHHSFYFASSKPFEGQNVLVVGNKLSAVDIAADLANSAKQVYMALGEGTWVLPRIYAKSTPYDFVLTRSLMYSRSAFIKINNMLMKEAQRNFDHEISGIRPNKPPLFAAIGLNDDLPLKLMAGKVKAYGRLTRLDGDKAHFLDGKMISGIDSVIFCTGYKPDFSFIDLDIIPENGKMELYRMMFPLRKKHNTLAIIGNVGGDFAVFGLLETQARLAVRVLAGKNVLPSQEKMKCDVDFWNAHSFARTGKYGSYYIAVALFMDALAKEIGCYPSFWKVFWRSPKLAFRNWYGPIFSAQYRLLGPDSQWDVYEKACLSLYDEGCTSLQHKDLKDMQRPDVHDNYMSKAINLAIFSAIVAFTVFMVAKYRDENVFANVTHFST